VANSAGEIFELEGYAAVGMAGSLRRPMTLDQTINMPYGGELMLLPDRRPVLLNMETGLLETLKVRWLLLIRPATLRCMPALIVKIRRPGICPFFHMVRLGGIKTSSDPP